MWKRSPPSDSRGSVCVGSPLVSPRLIPTAASSSALPAATADTFVSSAPRIVNAAAAVGTALVAARQQPSSSASSNLLSSAVTHQMGGCVSRQMAAIGAGSTNSSSSGMKDNAATSTASSRSSNFLQRVTPLAHSPSASPPQLLPPIPTVFPPTMSHSALLSSNLLATHSGPARDDARLRTSCFGSDSARTRPPRPNGEFPLSSNPELVLRILTVGALSAEDLAKLEVVCRFFRSPAGFPPDPAASIAEVAALDICRRAGRGLQGLGFNEERVATVAEIEREASRRGKKKLAERAVAAEDLKAPVAAPSAADPPAAAELALGAAESEAGHAESALMSVVGGGRKGLKLRGAELKARCGGSWKLALRFVLAREEACSSSAGHVAAGCAYSIAVSRKGEVFSFGHGDAGQLGHGPESVSEWRPRIVSPLKSVRIVQAAAGRCRTMLVADDGRVFHFGRECFGDQEYSMSAPPPIFTPRVVESLQGVHVVQVALGSFFTAVLSTEGRVFTFSWGQHERLGHATDLSDTQPRPLLGQLENIPVAQIAGGHCYLLALTCGGADQGRSVWSVGCGLGGKLGQGNRMDEKLPREITHFRALNFAPAAVAAGAWHAAARAVDGRVATWGWGRHGCLGHGSDLCENAPRVVQGLEGVKAVHVAAGDYTTFVVGAEGDVWSFGSAESSCLGHGSDEEAGGGEGEGAEAEVEFHVHARRQKDIMLPRRIRAFNSDAAPGGAGESMSRGERVVAISTSNAGHWDAHMLAMTSAGRLFACGSGGRGQLGANPAEGAPPERNVPEVLEGFQL